jgi:hypothetical protein
VAIRAVRTVSVSPFSYPSLNLNLSTANVLNFVAQRVIKPITVAARSEAWTLFASSYTGIVGSNATQGMDVCVLLFCVCVALCVVL